MVTNNLRRRLHLHSLDDILHAAEAIARAERVERLGDWSLGQILQHLAKSVESSLKQSEATLPLWRRAIGRLVKPILLRIGLPAGVQIARISSVAAAELLPDGNVTTDQGFHELQNALLRAGEMKMTARHNAFGPMSHNDWVKMHCRHAELHLGFIVPSDARDSERELSDHERGFQDLDTPDRRQIVSGVAFLSANIRSEIVWERVRTFVQANPQFQCRIVGGRSPEWRFDQSFDISRHCDEVELGDATTEQALSFVSNAASKGLPSDQPPWRVALLRVTKDGGQQERCAIAILAHHSLLDGLQGMKLYTSLLDRTARTPSNAPPSQGSASDHLAARNPVVSAKCVRAVAGEMLRRSSGGPFASNSAASANRKTLAFRWSRGSFQAARRNCDASFQEVLLATLTDGLARYSLSLGLERNVRAILPLGRSEGHTSSFTTNRHDVGFIELPTATARSRRYAEIRQNLQTLRREQEEGVFSSILGFMGRLPNAIRKAVAHRFAHQADLLISLIPGGRSKNAIDGAAVASVFAQPALPPRHSLVVGVTVTGRDVCVTVQADPARIACPDELKACFEEAYRQIVLEYPTENAA